MKIGGSLSPKNLGLLSSIADIENNSILYVTKNLYKYDLIIMESNQQELNTYLDIAKKAGKKIVLWGEGIKPSTLRYYLKEDIIYDYIDADSCLNLIGIINKVEEEGRRDIINISDSCKEIFLSLNKLHYITYDRVNRKTILNYGDKKVTLTKKLTELEFCLQPYGNFIKADRSTIVNTHLIEGINYKEESLVFQSGESISISKNKLKELREAVGMIN